MKLLKITAIFFLIQTIFITVWYALGVQTDPENVKNYKFFSWMTSAIATIVCFVLVLKKKQNRPA
jgi:hypothetical protein